MCGCSHQEAKPARNVHTATAADDAAPATEEAAEGGEEGAAAVAAVAVKGDEPMGDAEGEAAAAAAAVASDDAMGDAATAATAAVAAEPTVEVPLPVSSEPEVDAVRGAPVQTDEMDPETAAVAPVAVETAAVAAVAATAAVAAVAATAAVAGADTDAMEVGEAAVAPVQTDEETPRCASPPPPFPFLVPFQNTELAVGRSAPTPTSASDLMAPCVPVAAWMWRCWHPRGSWRRPPLTLRAERAPRHDVLQYTH